MSEEQLKAAETEATAQVEDGVEEISEEEIEGVAGGAIYVPAQNTMNFDCSTDISENCPDHNWYLTDACQYGVPTVPSDVMASPR